jgi:DNA-binding response OmpR family regulator
VATVLLVIGDAALHDACRAQLSAAGHAAVSLDRPLAPLDVASRVRWDVAVVDASELGRAALPALDAVGAVAPVIGLGLVHEVVRESIELPLSERTLTGAVAAATSERVLRAGALVLDAERRFASASGRDVVLTPIEFQILSVLFETRPNDVSPAVLLEAVWGTSEGRGGPGLVRAHVRNLRVKLNQIGLHDAVRSRRGRGYTLVV